MASALWLIVPLNELKRSQMLDFNVLIPNLSFFSWRPLNMEQHMGWVISTRGYFPCYI